MDLSIIMVTWNVGDVIENCLESIIKYVSIPFEVIIVDNNSTDNTINIIENKYSSFSRIIQNKYNVGFAKANNQALEVCKGKYVFYLNPDTILIEDVVTPMINKLDDRIGAVGCKLLNADYSLQQSCFKFDNPISIFFEQLKIGYIFPNFISEYIFPNTSKHKYNKVVDWVIGAAIMITTEDAIRIGGFSEEYFMYTEDMDFGMKVKRILKKKTYFLSNVKLVHLGGHSESKKVNSDKDAKMIRGKILFGKKFYGERALKKYYIALYLSHIIKVNLIKIAKSIHIMKKDNFQYYHSKYTGILNYMRKNKEVLLGESSISSFKS